MLEPHQQQRNVEAPALVVVSAANVSDGSADHTVEHARQSVAESFGGADEVSIIDNMASFLEAHGGTQLDQKVLRCMAEALTQHVNDTSPGTLQDVTMENSYSVGYRSPCVSVQQFHGATSPPASQGRSVREFEEQMASLRKENFNLKLRLYFIEESIPGFQSANGSDGQESFLKQHIDMKVEMEVLRKEMQEKQELLKEAALAMSQMELVQKKTEEEAQTAADDLKQKIEYLEMERNIEKSESGDAEMVGDTNIVGRLSDLQKSREMDIQLKDSQKTIANLTSEIAKLDEILLQRDEAIKEYEEKVKELVFQNAELLELLETKETEKAVTESTLTVKAVNSKHLLERIQEYEKMVTKINYERNLAKRENRFFRTIISKLQQRRNACLTIEKAEIVQHISTIATETTATETTATGTATATNTATTTTATTTAAIERVSERALGGAELIDAVENVEQPSQFAVAIPQEREQIDEHKRQYRRKTHHRRHHHHAQHYQQQHQQQQFQYEHRHRHRHHQHVQHNQQMQQFNGAVTRYDEGRETICGAQHDQRQLHHNNHRVHRAQCYSPYDNSYGYDHPSYGYMSDCYGFEAQAQQQMEQQQREQEQLEQQQLEQQQLEQQQLEQQQLDQQHYITYKNPAYKSSSSTSLMPTVAIAVACANGTDQNVADVHESGHFVCNRCPFNHPFDDTIPIRYTISDSHVMHNTASLSPTGSCSSLRPNYSSTSFVAGSHKRSQDFFITHLREELHEHKTRLADNLCMLQDSEEQLKNREKIHEQACRTIQKLMRNIKQQQGEIQRLKEQNSTLDSNVSVAAGGVSTNKEHTNGSGFECTGMCRSLSDSESHADAASSQKLIVQQEHTIKELRAEVKKKTANLQNLVNKELWEKNREIERLTKLVNKSASDANASPVSPNATHSTAVELQRSFSDVDYAKALERNKVLQRKVDILIQRLSAERSNEELIHQLRIEARTARADADAAEKWRRECAEVTAKLTIRLEELAGFLNSLLKYKDVLGVLAADRRRAIRKAVDRSLDLSKSLNMTLSVSGVSMGEQTFAQLNNLSMMLCDAEHDESMSVAGDADGADDGSALKTFNSHEAHSIETLQAENQALKKELDKRRSADASKKERRSLPLQAPPPLDHNNHSESEAWSEPDRKVSMARIGLDEHSASLSKEVATTVTPRRAGGGRETDSESDARMQNRSAKAAAPRSADRISQLEQMIAHRDERILDVQCQLVDADNRLKRENLLVLEMSQELQHLRERNEELHSDLIAIGSNESNAANSDEHLHLLQQLEEKAIMLERAQDECARVKSETVRAEMQIASLKADYERLQEQHQRAASIADEQEKQRLQQLRGEMEALLQQRLSEREYQHREALARDWIARSVYEECKQQLLELQRQYTEQQRNVDYMQDTEQELRQALLDNEHAERALKKQLDESTLQASRAVLERTKALSEKLQLEKRTQQLGSQLAAHEAERQALQQHVLQLEQQIAEAATARLNGSDMSQSGGYTSEEVVPQSGKRKNGTATTATTTAAGGPAAAVGAERQHNSSPDLGIESDVGRASSAELANVQRPMHKTVTLIAGGIKEEINADAAAEQDVSGVDKKPLAAMHDCAKVEQDCAELRRKLIRMKRAFEDTCEKLRVSNQRKAQVEKDIKNQILKTHNVLKNVRANMENEL